MPEELIPINILIADRTYRVRATPSDEEAIRKTIKTINDKIIEYKTQFSGKDMQDYIAMVIIWYATQTPAEQHEGNSDLLEKILKIEAILEKGF